MPLQVIRNSHIQFPLQRRSDPGQRVCLSRPIRFLSKLLGLEVPCTTLYIGLGACSYFIRNSHIQFPLQRRSDPVESMSRLIRFLSKLLGLQVPMYYNVYRSIDACFIRNPHIQFPLQRLQTRSDPGQKVCLQTYKISIQIARTKGCLCTTVTVYRSRCMLLLHKKLSHSIPTASLTIQTNYVGVTQGREYVQTYKISIQIARTKGCLYVLQCIGLDACSYFIRNSHIQFPLQA